MNRLVKCTLIAPPWSSLGARLSFIRQTLSLSKRVVIHVPLINGSLDLIPVPKGTSVIWDYDG